MQCCRCCLSESENLASMNATRFMNRDTNVVSFLEAYNAIVLSSNQEVMGAISPNNLICIECSTHLESAYIFRQLCIDANVALKNQAKKRKRDDIEKMGARTVKVEISTESSDAKYSCSECLETFQYLRMLRRHLKKVHPKTKSTTDTPITETMKIIAQMDQQGTAEDNHSNSDSFICEYCWTSYPTDDDLEAHILSHEMDDMEEEQDDDMKSEGQNSPKKPITKCQLCPNTFRTLSGLTRHMSTQHNTIHPGLLFNSGLAEGKFQCDSCDKSFHHLSTLKLHKEKHSNQKFDCILCSASYKHSYNLVTHMRKHNESSKPTAIWRCDKCMKKFKSQSGLVLHDQIHHQNLKHECRLCNSSYNNMMGLWRHAFDHLDGEEPYQCQYCSFGNRTKKDFALHLARKHNVEYDERSHGCKRTTKEILQMVRKPKPRLQSL